MVAALVEGGLRWGLGLGNPPLYVADSQVGYRLAPNQRLRRFSNRLAVNAHSMRGPEIDPLPPEGTVRLMLLGDSIANGGWWTDQDQILSQRLERQLRANAAWGDADLEVLNVSANSWGPRNELAYVAKFGTFGVAGIVLLLNTDDLFAIAPNSVQVGRDRNYPVRRPPLALWELATRFRPQRPLPELEALHQEAGDRVGVNLEAMRQLHRLITHQDGFLVVAMTPLLREVTPPGPKDYELEARQRLSTFLAQEQIPYLDFLAPFQASADPTQLYRDHIHLSPRGYEGVTTALVQEIPLALRGGRDRPQSIPTADPIGDPWQ